MYELELIASHEAAEEARDLLLHVCEVCTQDQIAKLCAILGEGGTAYNLQVIHKLLAAHGRLDESKRIGALFAEYKKGFGDPLVRASFLLGVKKMMKSNGELDAEEASEVLQEFGVAETQDIRDELQRMAIKKPDGGLSWSITDIIGTALTSATIASLARKVPWARIAKMILLRK